MFRFRSAESSRVPSIFSRTGGDSSWGPISIPPLENVQQQSNSLTVRGCRNCQIGFSGALCQTIQESECCSLRCQGHCVGELVYSRGGEYRESPFVAQKCPRLDVGVGGSQVFLFRFSPFQSVVAYDPDAGERRVSDSLYYNGAGDGGPAFRPPATQVAKNGAQTSLN